MRRLLLGLLTVSLLSTGSAFAAQTLDDFESETSNQEWRFSNGPEFPGATGSFSKSREAAHGPGFGGKLTFDFTGGGNYVSAMVTPARTMPADCNALRLWLKSPEGHGVQFRYTDSRGQTFQKPVECFGGRWEEVTIPFSGWASHWGGPDDGIPQGPPKSVAILLERGQETTGQLLFDQVSWVRHDLVTAQVAYPAYQFEPHEGWSMRSAGDGGSSQLKGKAWKLDFSKGAKSLSLVVPDRVLLGNVVKLRLRFDGSLSGHPVRLVMRTHFMTFHKTITNWPGEREIVIDAPPGEGWQWQGGENDGKIHGPLRLAEIEVGAGSTNDSREVSLQEITVETSCPAEKRCLLLASCTNDSGTARFTASIRALSDVELTGQLFWVLRDWEHNEVGGGSQTVSIPPLAETAHFNVPITAVQTAGKRFLEAEFRLELPGQKVPLATAVWLPPFEAKGDSTLNPSSPFGMGLYLNRYSGDARGLALMERAAQMARDAGAKWSREDFSWSRIEPRRGEFNWTYYDNLLACAKRNGISVYAIVGYWSGWTQPYTETGIQDYVRFVRALAGRYKKDIRQWEIWNEPNIFFWQGPKDMYADLLTRSYAAVKEVDPEAQVLGLSTAGIDTAYIKRMLELKAPFDILTIHPYRKQLNDVAFMKDLQAASDLVRLPDGKRWPVWLTEMGWATHTPHNTVTQDFAPNSERAQAELIARSYLCAIVSGVDPRTFWYNFRNDGEDPVYFEHQMGIVYHDFRPKPAYLTYATLARILKGLHLEGPITAPEGVLAFRFKGSGAAPAETIALWSPAGDSRVELPASREVLCINAVGESVKLSPVQGKVAVALKKGAPVYVVHGASAQLR